MCFISLPFSHSFALHHKISRCWAIAVWEIGLQEGAVALPVCQCVPVCLPSAALFWTFILVLNPEIVWLLGYKSAIWAFVSDYFFMLATQNFFGSSYICQNCWNLSIRTGILLYFPPQIPSETALTCVFWNNPLIFLAASSPSYMGLCWQLGDRKNPPSCHYCLLLKHDSSLLVCGS